MAAELESMFYVSNEENKRFVPWHGLGTSVENAPNSTEALVLAGLDWTVDQHEVRDATSGLVIPGYKANVRSSDNKALGIVGSRYNIVQNADAFAFTDALIGDEVKYETAGSLKDGRTIWLLAKMPIQKIVDDDVSPFLCFTNSHDGTGAVKVCMTPVRVVCNNTLNYALDTAKRTWSARHMGNVNTKLEEARATLMLARNYMTKLSDKAEEMATAHLDNSQINKMMDTLFPISADASDRENNNNKAYRDQFTVCMFAPDLANFYNTKWAMVNAASDFATHSTPNRITSNYAENNWGKVINGHPLIDQVYAMMDAE